jgi:hypothetical protein
MPLHTQTITAPKLLSSWLKYEVNSDYTRSVGVLLAGAGAARDIKAGELLGKVTASGKLVAWDPAAVDGSEDAVGVAVFDATATAAVDDRVAYLARGPAIVFAPEFVWPAGATAEQKAAAVADLAALGIVAQQP